MNHQPGGIGFGGQSLLQVRKPLPEPSSHRRGGNHPPATFLAHQQQMALPNPDLLQQDLTRTRPFGLIGFKVSSHPGAQGVDQGKLP